MIQKTSRSFRKFVSIISLCFVVSFSGVFTAFSAASADLAFNSSSISFSKSSILEGQTLRIYVTANNLGSDDALGNIKVLDLSTGQQIGADQVVSAVAQKSDTVFVDWKATPGNHNIQAKIIPWKSELDNPDNNLVSRSIFVDLDTDRDGIANQYDNDDDNDGVVDTEDDFPLDSKENKDTDGDGVGDNADEDADNDGVPNNEDALPLDNTESKDTDGDGIGDNADQDDDNDGIKDMDEDMLTGTDNKNKDTDGDEVIDGQDAFPLDPNESQDYDKDGIGNNGDNDADNDGIDKNEDTNDTNKGPIVLLSEIPRFILPNSKVNLDGGPSYDEDGSISSFEWSIKNENGEEMHFDNNDMHNKSIQPVFERGGSYQVSLKITDDKGEMRQHDFKIYAFNYVPLLILLLLILIALAVYFTIKYTSRAKKLKKHAAEQKKATKVAPIVKKTTSKKITEKKQQAPAPKTSTLKGKKTVKKVK